MPVYIISTREFGDIRKRADNIDEARRWAITALAPYFPTVTREVQRPRCDRCDSRPCECPKRPRRSNESR